MISAFIYNILAPIFVFGVLIFIHEFGHFLMAKRNGVRVEKFSFGFGPKIWGKKVGETEYLVSAVPLGGYIKMAGDEPRETRKGTADEFLSKTCGQRARIIAFGPILNYLLAFFIFSIIFVIGSPTITTRVGEVLDDYPAEAAGVKKDDLVLAVEGERVQQWQEMAEIIHQNTEGKITLDVQRNDKVYKIKVKPRVEEHQDLFGQKIKIALIGIYPSDETAAIKYPIGKSFYKGAEKLLSLTGLTYRALWFMVIRRISFKDSLTGPIGIFYFTGEAARLGFIYLLNLMGILSMSLAIFNFLPLPVLDGGHLFFLLLEKIRRKPVSVRVQEVATQAGVIILIGLMLFVFYNDLARFGLWDKAKGAGNNISQNND
jgi:regulator of sigma E protease